MKIFFGHSSDADYKRIYNKIRNLKLDHDIVLPHEFSKEPFTSKEYMDNIDLFVAEVSMPSTGLGIELAWAKECNVPIVFMHKKGSKFSDCLRLLSCNFIEYSDDKDFVEKFIDIISQSS
jgi:hypothetical protein